LEDKRRNEVFFAPKRIWKRLSAVGEGPAVLVVFVVVVVVAVGEAQNGRKLRSAEAVRRIKGGLLREK